MAENQDRIDLLNQKIETLLKKQEDFVKELRLLYKEVQEVKKPKQLLQKENKKTPLDGKNQPIDSTTPSVEPIVDEIKKESGKRAINSPKSSEKFILSKNPKSKEKSNLEKFIGENIINKIGIIILVIGVAIGAKYSIENNLISPLTRIILGYISGISLIGFSIKLKAKYESYSAVLLSGALVILYFITFAAYDFYNLFSQITAFGLMLLFTVFGLVAALNYNKQIIAHLGLVGAYAIPFLLSNDSGNISVLFSYITIINMGILVLSFKKYWKYLYYSAFFFTWLIYSVFIASSYDIDIHYKIALIFVSIFFFVFYITFLAYKLIGNEKFKISDIIMLLLNSFIFYGYGYFLLSNQHIGSELLGIFTLLNASTHFVISVIIFKKKLADRNLFYLVSGLVLIFITIAIPVQLNGNWVTLLWVLEAALLYWIGRTKNVLVYENLSYLLMILALFSLLQDWLINYNTYNKDSHFISIFNINFLSSILFATTFGLINWINHKTTSLSRERKRNLAGQIMSYGIPIIFLVALYGLFFIEIEYYWNKLFINTKVSIEQENGNYVSVYNYNLKYFNKIWLINYTLLFLTILTYINTKKIKHEVLGIVTLIISVIVSIIFLTGSLYILSVLRENYLAKDLSLYHEISSFNIGIRYVSFGFFALFLMAIHKLTGSNVMSINLKIIVEILIYISILCILSSELLNWIDISGSKQTFKLGLSILWGVYSLSLIIIGIWKKKKYLRIGAILLFTITLLKLFIYDITAMNTIKKTIVFVCLGILLLIISFLYTKYKNIITDDTKK